MAAFSRIQLAAALLEYDNDVSNPAITYRSAHESAIFSHLRRNGVPRPKVLSARSTDYLGVSLPSEGGSVSGRESAMSVGHRKSGSSIHALRNPFGGDAAADEDEEPEKDDLEVDLASWGLDAFMPKDKAGKNAVKLKGRLDILPNPHPVISLRQGSRSVVDSERRKHPASRSLSMGDFGAGGAFLDARLSTDRRPRSVGDVLDQREIEPPQALLQRRRASSHALIESLPLAPPLHSIPFPTSGSRSGSPARDDNERLASQRGPRASGSGYLLDDKPQPHSRTYSSNSLRSRRVLDEREENVFTRPPSLERTSRFDPKPNHARTMSNATMGTLASRNHFADDDNMFAVRPPSPTRSSRFDPKMAAHARTMSNASLGSRMLLDNDGVSFMGGASMMSGRPQQSGDRPYSTLDLLRPKVLVMPSPLQPTSGRKEAEPPKLREGFHLSTDGPPLPAGARSARATSAAYDPSPIASHLFTPNPRMSLSLSQLAFRNTLMVGGERDVTYSDIDRTLPRATEEGVQMQILVEEPEIEEPHVEDVPIPTVIAELQLPGRPAGKLFGKSLIDDLENRKAKMRSKQRVFKGDDRPSMMARAQVRRSGTLIDPESLQKPISRHRDSLGPPPALGRRNSANIRPLLDFDDNLPGSKPTLHPNSRARDGRSVFGTDTLWEREMVKLKEIEAQEQLEKEEREAREAEEATRLDGKKKKSKKSEGKSIAPVVEQNDIPREFEDVVDPVPRISATPPLLPAIQKAIVRGPPPINNDDNESESDSSAQHAPARRKAHRSSAETAADRWVAGSSDEDERAPRRTTGVGLRYQSQGHDESQPPDDDSEEDMPLAATVRRALQRAMSSGDDDSDSDVPLSAMLDKAKISIPPVNFNGPPVTNAKTDDDDDQPLGLRASMIPPSSHSYAGDDDDDKPLAFHPDQQRRTQYQVMAQQQQMMMQTQMQQSMFFGAPSMMGSGFFGPSMMMGPPALQQPVPSLVPTPDAAKFGLVDRWRRDVAVEGHP